MHVVTHSLIFMTYACIRSHTYTRTHTYSRTHLYDICIHTLTHIHTYTYILTDSSLRHMTTYSHTHTHIHTCRLGTHVDRLNGSLSHMRAITDLSLQHNLLTTFPSAIASLSQLQSLNLSQNNITHVPPGVFPNLRKAHTVRLWIFVCVCVLVRECAYTDAHCL
jgi:hypothetical protein